MHVPTGRFAGCEQPGHVVGLAILVDAYAAHRIMLRRAYRYQVVHRVETDEIAADVVNLSQLGCQVFLAKVANVEPQVRAVRRFDAVTIAHALRHVPGYNIAACEFLLLGLCLHHEALQILVEQVTTIAATTLRNQDAAG